jgi:hypothetical protein
MPDVANFSYSSYVVWVAFHNGLWRLTENVRGISKIDHSECSNHTSTAVVFSPDLLEKSRSRKITEPSGLDRVV